MANELYKIAQEDYEMSVAKTRDLHNKNQVRTSKSLKPTAMLIINIEKMLRGAIKSLLKTTRPTVT